MPPPLGTRMRNAPPQDFAGGMGVKYLRLLHVFLVEVQAYLEDGTFEDISTTLEAFELRLSALEAKMAAIEEAVVTNPDGNTTLRVYDARMERVLDTLVELLLDVRENLARREEKDPR